MKVTTLDESYDDIAAEANVRLRLTEGHTRAQLATKHERGFGAISSRFILTFSTASGALPRPRPTVTSTSVPASPLRAFATPCRPPSSVAATPFTSRILSLSRNPASCAGPVVFVGRNSTIAGSLSGPT